MKAYSERLKENDDLGELGDPEYFETNRTIRIKIKKLIDLFKKSSKIVVITGAGISTSCGIPDFRGPSGVWTLKKGGRKIDRLDDQHCFEGAIPTLTHQSIKRLLDLNRIGYLITQNVDNLHTKSGITKNFAELHGNIMKEICSQCGSEYIRDFDVGGMSFKKTGDLIDFILDWDDALPEKYLEESRKKIKECDLLVCVGSSLRVKPVGEFPQLASGHGAKVCVINLQRTEGDPFSDLVIRYYCDYIFQELMKGLNIRVPKYVEEKSFVIEVCGSPSTFLLYNKTDEYRSVIIKSVELLFHENNREKILLLDNGKDIIKYVFSDSPSKYFEVIITFKEFVTCDRVLRLGKYEIAQHFKKEIRVESVYKDFEANPIEYISPSSKKMVDEDEKTSGKKRKRNHDDDEEDEVFETTNLEPPNKKKKE